MNEKIKDILVSSGLMDSIGEYAYAEDNWEPVVSKFAELIIHECIQICDESRSDYQSHRKSAHDPEDRLIYNEGIAASDFIKHKIFQKLGYGRLNHEI